MTILERIRNGEDGILVIGNHAKIVQSILDFDYLSGKERPSVVGIIAGNRRAQKFFWGREEFLLPCFAKPALLPVELASRVRFMLNLQSGRRAFETAVSFFETFPKALGGHLFAENVPERHATELIKRYGGTKLIAGPSGVGLLVPKFLKLGAIGGIDAVQISEGRLTGAGSVAVVSTSGGMTNELIHGVARAGKELSFAISIGGDRFPIASLTDVLTLAQEDPATKALVYFGELGGEDEYEIAAMMKEKKFTKPLVAYIAGVIDEAFDEHMQFGHAKALVARQDESARAKRSALREAGAEAPDTFPEFLRAFTNLPGKEKRDTTISIEPLMNREKSILSTREIIDLEHAPTFIRGKKLAPAGAGAFVRATLAALLGKEPRSPVTSAFTEALFTLSLDHGGAVSGAVNTMITARAGKDLVSSLAAGLLTIGPRFGGAVNDAAKAWQKGVSEGKPASEFVESETKGGKLILGIGHLKYRVGLDDPRVKALSEFASLLKKHPHYDFARSVEKVTTAKNGNLILNVDGTIAALMLDILSECEGYSEAELAELADAEFFNALFVIPRSVGFIAHFMEQKRNDEGLFRLPENLLFVRKDKKKDR
ncbi:hypothetical protein KGQ55_03000 [Patescibacteria group bacterium]|nr:hypothetical protein [Patescibacteria group bacterium]